MEKLSGKTVPTSQILFAIVIMAGISTVIAYIYFMIMKRDYYIYLCLKYFYLVLFILWINKYLTCKVNRILNIEYNEPGCEVTEDSNETEDNFFTKVINVIFE